MKNCISHIGFCQTANVGEALCFADSFINNSLGGRNDNKAIREFRTESPEVCQPGLITEAGIKPWKVKLLK